MHTLDCRTLPCPQPVLRCRAFLEEHQTQACAVLVDNAAAAENVRRFLEQRGFAVRVVHEGNTWTLTAAREGDPPPTSQKTSAPISVSPEKARTLVFITTETMGRGSDELGAKLMEAFLSTLPEMGDALWRIVLLNGGVKLCAAPGAALDALRGLEASGVSLLVCGTCLAHYGLAEAKAVGETSNMLDIVTSLQLADKVIRP